MPLSRRPATESDIPFLLQLRRETMDAHLAASGASTGEKHHMERLLYRFECAEVLLQEGEPVGLLKVARDTAEWKIIQIQLSPDLQGLGIGSRILEEIVAETRAANVELVLGVLKANPARALYERLGFVVEREDGDEYFMRLRR